MINDVITICKLIGKYSNEYIWWHSFSTAWRRKTLLYHEGTPENFVRREGSWSLTLFKDKGRENLIWVTTSNKTKTSDCNFS